MSNYNSNRRGGRGKDNFSRDSRPERSRVMTQHTAICSECGKKCTVPFVPTGDKPVFCSDCFEKRGGKSDSRRGGGSSRPSFAGPNNKELVEKMDQMNKNLEKIIELLSPKPKTKKVTSK